MFSPNSSTTTLRSPHPPGSPRVGNNNNHNNIVSPSPQQKEEAKKRAAFSVVRAAMALHRASSFDNLPAHAKIVTRAMASDEQHFLAAIEEFNKTQQQNQEVASLNNTSRSVNNNNFSNSFGSPLSGTNNNSLGGTLRSATAATARPLSASVRSNTKNINENNKNHTTPPRNNCNPLSVKSPTNIQNDPTSTTSPGSRQKSPSRFSPIKGLSARRSPARHFGISRQAYSPLRPLQLNPTSINLQQVFNEVKLRIPVLRRSIAASTASGTDIRAVAENVGKIFTLMDAKNSGLLSLHEIASFGKRMGGQTQQLFKTSEMKARLHNRFPTVYPSPAIIHADEMEKLQQQQHHHHQQQFLHSDLHLDNNTNNNFGNTFTATAAVPPAFVNNNSLGFNPIPNMSKDNNSINKTPASGTLPSGSANLLWHVPSSTSPEGSLLPPPKISTKPNVKVRTPNPYEDPISREVFIDAIVGASSSKWVVAAASASAGDGGGGDHHHHHHHQSVSGLRKKLSSVHHLNPSARSSRSPTSTSPTRPGRVLESENSVGRDGAIEESSASKPTSRGGRARPMSAVNKRDGGNSRIQRTASIISTASFGASSESPSTTSNISAPNLSATAKDNNNNNLIASRSGSIVSTCNNVSGSGRKSAIPTDPYQRSLFLRVIQILDPKDTGFVTLDNLLKNLPKTSSVDAIVAPQFSTRSLFEQHDIDGDNRLTIEEFADMYRASFLPDDAFPSSSSLQNGNNNENNDDDDSENEFGSKMYSAGDRLKDANVALAAAEAKKKEVEFSYKGRNIVWTNKYAAATRSGGSGNVNSQGQQQQAGVDGGVNRGSSNVKGKRVVGSSKQSRH